MIQNRFLKKSIWSKVFIMNLLILGFILVIQLVFQAFFFEKYYISKKKKSIEQEMLNFEKYIDKESKTGEENKSSIMEYIQKVNRKTGIDISVRNSDITTGVCIENYMKNNYLLLKDKNNNNIYKVILGDVLSDIKLSREDEVKVIGAIDIYGYIIPETILINDVQLPVYGLKTALVMPYDTDNEENYKKLRYRKEIYSEGSIIDIEVKNDNLVNFNNILNQLPTEIENSIINSNEYTTIYNNKSDSKDYLISTKKLDERYIVAIIQLTAVDDVISTMDSFYLKIFLILLIFVGVVSLIYSKIITKPLINMSKVAKEISKSNFDIKYEVKSEDEIGILGGALNSIGNNLKETLENLKEEMKVQKLQEEKRKELVANISHELKTPITIIQGNIQGLQSGIYKEDKYKDILEETTRMNNLVMEMLELSMLEEPTFKLEIGVFDLYNSTLKELDNLKTLYDSKNIKVNLQLASELQYEEIVVHGDEIRIGDVLRNLITNAIKYTPEGEYIIIKIEDKEDKYKFTIENYGTTLSEIELKNIWEPFYRKEKSRNKKFGGTGLGLYIVKRILQLHNSNFGSYSIKNSVGFYFSLNKADY